MQNRCINQVMQTCAPEELAPSSRKHLDGEESVCDSNRLRILGNFFNNETQKGVLDQLKEDAQRAKIVIKTPSGEYVGGERETELVDRITRAYLYEDTPDTDAQIAQVNQTYACGWYKVDAETEYDRWINNQGE